MGRLRQKIKKFSCWIKWLSKGCPTVTATAVCFNKALFKEHFSVPPSNGTSCRNGVRFKYTNCTWKD